MFTKIVSVCIENKYLFKHILHYIPSALLETHTVNVEVVDEGINQDRFYKYGGKKFGGKKYNATGKLMFK